MLCKTCKNNVRPADIWYLFDNYQFKNRKLFVGKCSKCKSSVILLQETRKSDNRIFSQLEVGSKADKVAEIHLEQIDYTREDREIKKGKPFGFSFGKAKKELKNKRYGIYRVDFNNQDELIGYMPFNSSFIEDKEK